MLVTRSLPQARQLLAPCREPRWVSEPSGTWGVTVARGIEISRSKERATAERADPRLPGRQGGKENDDEPDLGVRCDRAEAAGRGDETGIDTSTSVPLAQGDSGAN